VQTTGGRSHLGGDVMWIFWLRGQDIPKHFKYNPKNWKSGLIELWSRGNPYLRTKGIGINLHKDPKYTNDTTKLVKLI
jgi:hypothetical protein